MKSHRTSSSQTTGVGTSETEAPSVAPNAQGELNADSAAGMQSTSGNAAVADLIAEQPASELEGEELGGDGLAQGSGGQATGAPPPGDGADDGGGDGWLASLVAQISPELAEVIDEGLLGAFEDDIVRAIDEGLLASFGDIQVETFAEDLSEAIGGAAGMLVGASLGDQACCTAFEGWLGGFTKSADDFVRGGSLLAQLSELVGGKMAASLAKIGAMVDATGIVELIGGTIDGIAGKVQGWLDTVYALNQTLGDQVAEYFGLDASANGLVGLIAEQVAQYVSGLADQLREAVDGLLEFVFSFTLFDQLHDLVDFALEMRDGMAWLHDHWGDPEIWTKAGELQAQLPVFYELLMGGKARWDALVGGATSNAQATIAILDGWLVQLTGVPLASGVIDLVTGLVDGIRWIIESPVWGEISTALGAAGQFALDVVRLLIDAASAVGLVLASPAAILPVMMGAAIRSLPECYRAPIFDLFITIAAGALTGVLLPVAAVMPLAAPMLQAALEGALDGMLTLDVAQKEAMLVRVGELLSVGFVDELLGGFLVGVVDGIVDEVVGLYDMLKLLSNLVDPFFYMGLVWDQLKAAALDGLGAVVEGAESFDDLGDRAKGEDDYAPVPDVEAPTPTDPPPEMEDPLAGDVGWSTLEELLGGLVGDFQAKVSEAMAEHTQQMATDLLDLASEGPYTVGWGVGWLTGWALVQLGIAAATMGIGELVNLGRTTLQGIVAAARGGWVAMKASLAAAVAAGRAFIDDAARALEALGSQFGRVAAWLRSVWDDAWAWFDDLVAKLTGKEPRAPKGDVPEGPPKGDAPDGTPPKGDGPDAPKDDGPDGDPSRKPKKGPGEDDDTPLGKLATADAKAAWQAFEKDGEMVPRADADAFLSKQDETRDGVRFDVEPAVVGGVYKARSRATEGTESVAREHGDGWIATEGSAEFVAPSDESARNQGFIDFAAEELQAAWDRLGDENRLSVEAIEEEAARIKRLFVPAYDEMAFSVAFSGFDEEQALVHAELVIAPNERRKPIDLRYRKADKDFDGQFAEGSAIAFEDHMTSPWTVELNKVLTDNDLAPVATAKALGLVEGRGAVRAEVEAWFRDRSTPASKQPWVDRIADRILGYHRSVFFEPALRTLEEELRSRLSDRPDLLGTLEVEVDEAILTLGDSPPGASDDLKKAVTAAGGIVEFLIQLKEGGAPNGVGAAQFADAAHPAGWDRLDSAGSSPTGPG